MNAIKQDLGTCAQTLIIILAETRAADITFELFEKNLLDVFGADIALCVGNNSREDLDNLFYKRARYIWRYDEQETWDDALDELSNRKGSSQNWRILLQLQGMLMGGVKGHQGSGAIGLFFRAFLKECLTDNNLFNSYEQFIITRSDFLHEIPHLPPELLDKQYIWIPDGEYYGGITDRHIICPNDLLPEYLSMVEKLITEPESLYCRMEHQQDWNIEKFLKFQLAETGLIDKVRYFPYSMYTVRSKEGATRWSAGQLDPKNNFYIKYKSEYLNSQLAIKAFRSRGQWDKYSIGRYNQSINLRRKFSNAVQLISLIANKFLFMPKSWHDCVCRFLTDKTP